MILICVYHLFPAETVTESLSVNNDFNNSLNPISALLLKCGQEPGTRGQGRTIT